MKVKARIKFEPKDMWIGVVWDWDEPYGRDDSLYSVIVDVLCCFICVIPCFPICLTFEFETATGLSLNTRREK